MRSFTAEAVIAALAGEVRQTVAASPGATVRVRLRSTARLLRLPVSRVGDWFYGEVRRVEAHEADQIRHYAAEARRRLARREREYSRIRAELVDHAPAGVARLAPPRSGAAAGGADSRPRS